MPFYVSPSSSSSPSSLWQLLFPVPRHWRAHTHLSVTSAPAPLSFNLLPLCLLSIRKPHSYLIEGPRRCWRRPELASSSVPGADLGSFWGHFVVGHFHISSPLLCHRGQPPHYNYPICSHSYSSISAPLLLIPPRLSASIPFGSPPFLETSNPTTTTTFYSFSLFFFTHRIQKPGYNMGEGSIRTGCRLSWGLPLASWGVIHSEPESRHWCPVMSLRRKTLLNTLSPLMGPWAPLGPSAEGKEGVTHSLHSQFKGSGFFFLIPFKFINATC